jgi:hypothetical protein
MSSVRAGPSAQTLAVSQPFGLPNGVILQGLTAVGLAYFFSPKIVY